MGVINNESLAKLEGCFDECFKISGIVDINGGWDTAATTTDDGIWGAG